MRKPDLPESAGPIEWIGPDSLLYDRVGLAYCARVPESATLSQPAPAVVMLHGWGGDESAMWAFRQVTPAKIAVFTPRAPLDPGIGGFVWFTYLDAARTHPDPTVWQRSLTRLRYFLRALPDIYPIDPTRLVLMGFSQGAAMANSLALSGFKDLKGVVSLSGFIPDLPDLLKHAQPLSGLPVFIVHGRRDDVVPLSEARRARDVYVQLGANVAYREDPVGHKVHTRALQELRRWLVQLITAKS